MSTPGIFQRYCLAFLLVAALVAEAQSTSFTYQGQLRESGEPAEGVFDLRFTLFDAASGGAQQGAAVTHLAQAVQNGVFAVPLDFGASAFTNGNRWIEVAVRTNGGTSFLLLSPRQAVTAAPLALYALTPAGPIGPIGPIGPTGASPFTLVGSNAVFVTGSLGLGITNPATALHVRGAVTADTFVGSGSGLSALPASQLSGSLPPASLAGTYGSVLLLTNPANQFAGSGAGVTGLNASHLTTGTVPDARLASLVARTNQVWLLGGNAGTVSGSDFLGTTDNHPLELRTTNGVGINTNLPKATLHVAGSVMATNFLGSATGLTNLNGAALLPGSVPATAIAPRAIRVADLEDGGAAAYANATQIARSMSAAEPLPFEALSLVVSNTGATPSFTFSLGGSDFSNVVAFSGREGISEPYDYVVEVLLPAAELVPAEQLGRRASLRFLRNGRATQFQGLVTGCSIAGADTDSVLYTFRLESQLAYLALSTDYRIYQQQKVPEVAASLFQTATSNALSLSLNAEYPVHEYIAQLAESDLNFFSRLLEDQGIFYFFDPTALVPILGDDPSAYLTAANSPFRYYGNTATNAPAGAEFVRTFQGAAHESTLRATLRSYDFTHPTLDVTASASNTAGGRGDRYEFATSGATVGDNRQLASVRVERQQSARAAIAGSGNAPDLRPGHTFTLDDRSAAGVGGTYVVTAVRHGAFRRVTNGVASVYYGNQFEVVPTSLKYRPALKTPKPIASASTAKVTGPASEEIHVDQYGRVKVQFHWDRRGTNDDHSSAWIRCTSPLAGKGWGALFLPRVGQEVLVDFIDGNPDQPVITGGLYNAVNVVPYNLPANKTRSAIKTRSTPGGAADEGNEIRFEDLKGSEEVYVHAQKDLTVDVLNNVSVKAAGDYDLTGGHDVDIKSSGNIRLAAANVVTVLASSLHLPASVGIGGANNAAYALTVSGGVSASSLTLGGAGRLSDNDLFLRSGTDTYHGLGWYGAGKLFAGLDVNGPALYGNGGGALGSVGGVTNVALRWDNGGNVSIGAQLNLNASIVMNDKDILLRNDLNHGVGWYGSGKTFAAAAPDGPVLYGYSGGGLGSVRSGSTTNLALSWNNSGNVGIGTASPSQRLHVVGNIYATGTITPNSDRNLKTDFTPVDTEALLDKVVALPIQQWRFTNEVDDVKHVGPMAQDFQAAFGLGAIPTAIATVDADGVALAAIQGLNRKVEQQRAENAILRQELRELKELVGRLTRERTSD